MKQKQAKEKVLLTRRQTQVLKLICDEYTSEEIAKKVKLSERTIHGIRERLIKKIKCSNAIGLVKYSIKNKIYILK